MKRLPIVIIAALLLVTVGYGAYSYGVERAENKAQKSYDTGYAAGRESVETGEAVIAVQTETISNLQADYKELVEKYNQLVNYANTPQYKPIRCTSTYNGMSAFTNCY
jgi:archaellum component FlaF (FlaF/FlaG flagellin family)